jgi:hypothetical protein
LLSCKLIWQDFVMKFSLPSACSSPHMRRFCYHPLFSDIFSHGRGMSFGTPIHGFRFHWHSTPHSLCRPHIHRILQGGIDCSLALFNPENQGSRTRRFVLPRSFSSLASLRTFKSSFSRPRGYSVPGFRDGSYRVAFYKENKALVPVLRLFKTLQCSAWGPALKSRIQRNSFSVF